MQFKEDLNPLFIGLIGTLFLMFLATGLNKTWTKGPISSDAEGYYIYLSAFFYDTDFDFDFLSNEEFIKKNRSYLDEYFLTGWYLKEGIADRKFPKFAIGTALHQLPVFLIFYVLVPPETANMGFGESFQWIPIISSYLLVISSYWFLFLFIKRFCDPFSSAFAITALMCGTNYYFYSTLQPGYSHHIVFFHASLILWSSYQFYRGRKKYLIIIATSLAFVAITRPTWIVLGFIPLLYGVANLRDISKNIAVLLAPAKELLIAITLALLIISLQLFTWYYTTGNLIVYSYDEEGFNFLSPALYKGLFSPMKGWLFYSPLLVFPLISIFLYRKKLKKHLTYILIVLCLAVWINLSWSCWYYGGGYGMRALMECIPLLALPLAVYIENLKNIISKLAFALIVALCIALTMFLSAQTRLGLIDEKGMSIKSHTIIFGKLSLTASEKKELKESLTKE